MASSDPFNFAHSPAVAAIPCLECGNNMRCVRRQQMNAGEQQSFLCVACGSTSERVAGLQPSDNEIQLSAEIVAGLKMAGGKIA